MLIDFHTHCFPDSVAAKAIPKLSFASGGLKPGTDGTVNGLLESMKKHSVDVSVVLSIATNAHQQKSVNDFAAATNNKQDLFAFGSVYPFADDALEELDRIKALGLLGVKLHPDYQGFDADDPKVFPVYQKISALGLITVFHAGYDYGFPPPYGATPEKMAVALRQFSSPVIAAHWGGIGCCDGVLSHLCGEDIYFDISFGYGAMPKYYAEKILEVHGAKRILFGTDTPWHSPEMELRVLDTLKLSDVELEMIKSENAKKLLGVE